MVPRAQATKVKTNRASKIKTFCAKETIKTVKRKLTDWEKTFAK